jgi:hypothetical protein
MTRAAPVACTLASIFLVASCGGGGGGGGEGHGGGGGSSTSAKAGKPATPQAAFRCLVEAGLDVKSTPPGSSQVVSALAVDSGKPTQVLVWFARSASAAKDYGGKAAKYLSNAGGNATAEVVAKKVVVGRGPKTTGGEVNQVEGCLTS